MIADPILSVSIIAYNHERYLADAIESVLQQNVDYSFEIIIGDDCSSDGTQEVIREYEVKYPGKIFGIYHPKRYDEVPGRSNNITNLYACRGKYVAMLDGDDKWISRDKLQKQIEFLEDNPEYSLTFHDALVVYESGRKSYLRSEKTFPFLTKKNDYTHHDVAAEWFMPTSSIVFRNVFNEKELPEWFRKVIRADYALLLILTTYGKARYFQNLQSVRLINNKSFTKTYMKSLQVAWQLVEEMELYGEKFKAVRDNAKYNHNRYWYVIQYMQIAFQQKDRKAQIKGLRRMYGISPYYALAFISRYLKVVSRKVFSIGR